MLGFKIFDRDSEELTNRLCELAKKDNLALEIALYGNNIPSFTEMITKNTDYVNNPNKSIHLNYNKYLVSTICQPQYWQQLMIELNQAKNLLIKQGVIHYQTPSNSAQHLEFWKINNMIGNLQLLYKAAKDNDFTFYIENTYILSRKHVLNDLPHHKLLWDTILDLGMHDRIGLCLDWGHVKAFSNSALSDWIEYAKFLQSRGMPIYMHAHDNDSIKDLHCSFKESEEREFPHLNHPYDKPYLEILNDIHQEFKKESIILEYKSDIAEEHYLWTKNKLEQQAEEV